MADHICFKDLQAAQKQLDYVLKTEALERVASEQTLQDQISNLSDFGGYVSTPGSTSMAEVTRVTDKKNELVPLPTPVAAELPPTKLLTSSEMAMVESAEVDASGCYKNVALPVLGTHLDRIDEIFQNLDEGIQSGLVFVAEADAASICCKKLTAIQELQEANVDGNSKIVSFVFVPSEDLYLSSCKISPFHPCGQEVLSWIWMD